MKCHSKALVFFAVSKQIPVVYSANNGRAEIIQPSHFYIKIPQIYTFVFLLRRLWYHIKMFIAVYSQCDPTLRETLIGPLFALIKLL